LFKRAACHRTVTKINAAIKLPRIGKILEPVHITSNNVAKFTELTNVYDTLSI